jgi:hypothetical protein
MDFSIIKFLKKLKKVLTKLLGAYKCSRNIIVQSYPVVYLRIPRIRLKNYRGCPYNKSDKMLTEVIGNILDSNEDFILQQNCCTTTKAQGLSLAIAQKWPLSDPYRDRVKAKGNWATIESRDTPGSIKVLGKVICLFSQYSHGKPNGGLKDPLNVVIPDSAEDRLQYFVSCLNLVSDLAPKSVAIPFKIGCGLAGGNWQKYYNAISDWALLNPSISVKIYKLP